jgi:uncharacterized protein (TIGR02246 family)
MRVLLASVVMAIVMSVSAFAQQGLSDADAKQKAENLAAKVRAAYMSNDAAANYSKLFTNDGVLVALTGKDFRGQQQIEQATQVLIKRIGPIKSFEAPVDEAHALTDGTIWAIGHATIVGSRASIKDHWAAVDVPQGDQLYLRVLSLGADMPPPTVTERR